MASPGHHYTFLTIARELLKCSISDGEGPGDASAEYLFLGFYCCYLVIRLRLAPFIERIYRKEQYNFMPLDIKINYQDNFISRITLKRHRLES